MLGEKAGANGLPLPFMMKDMKSLYVVLALPVRGEGGGTVWRKNRLRRSHKPLGLFSPVSILSSLPSSD